MSRQAREIKLMLEGSINNHEGHREQYQVTFFNSNSMVKICIIFNQEMGHPIWAKVSLANSINRILMQHRYFFNFKIEKYFFQIFF